MVNPTDTSSGYGIGVINEESEKPFVTEIPVPPSVRNSLTLKLTMTYADVPGAALSNGLNLVVKAGDRERHGNQGQQEFDNTAAGSFDRRNNVEQVIWPQIPGDNVKIIIKPYRLDRVRVEMKCASLSESFTKALYLLALRPRTQFSALVVPSGTFNNVPNKPNLASQVGKPNQVKFSLFRPARLASHIWHLVFPIYRVNWPRKVAKYGSGDNFRGGVVSPPLYLGT
ncbi:uncharacterized protein BKA55DRAFT_679798 [Fusarium redolens]|uniref:Uncharacterized protein n=1 Tax=Fusarium redolens TaxID=48865 RepID=A0A9P9JR01_FUSRE|nr:uncharacterized protein BKA55DRAFT_679798 [Fusarium redolens]KAH7233788.1 hypothetical protein BKA55DRAFT_679798 [Fusarium redolens]